MSVVPGLPPSSARTALGRPALWAGRSLVGLKLTRIDVADVSVTEHDRGDRRFEGRQLAVFYGDRVSAPDRPDARGVESRSMLENDPARSLLGDDGGPPPPGFVDVDSGRISTGPGDCELKPCDAPGPDESFESRTGRLSFSATVSGSGYAHRVASSR
ncbi:MAG: hypothetical protein ABR583_10915 [Gaiellaceae bacterium]